MSLEHVLARVEARAKAKALEPVPARTSIQALAPVQLPFWPDSVRGVPNGVLRCALFGAVARGRRAFLQGLQVASVEGLRVLFTGPRLDQADLDVFEQCLNLARKNGVGVRIEFTAKDFLKAIGRATGGKNIEWLQNAFRRLASSVVEIIDGKRAYFGPMIHNGTRDDETGRYVIQINPAIVALYGSDGWTQIEWEQRMAIKGQPLAQWLHGFFSTHAQPYAYKVETLRGLCGSQAAELKHFRADLRDALGKLAAATGWTWEVDAADLVHIETAPSSSQRRHLAKRRKTG